MADADWDAGEAAGNLRSSGMIPAPGLTACGERDIWTVRAPLRAILPMLLIGGIASAALFSYAGAIVQALDNATYPLWPRQV